MKKPMITLTVTSAGAFIAFVDDVTYEGKIDRDAIMSSDTKWKKGKRPKDPWTRIAIYHAVSYLVGLLPRLG